MMNKRIDYEGIKKRCYKRCTYLFNEYTSAGWRDHHKDIADYLLPRKGRFLHTDTKANQGSKRNANIIDNTAGRAINVLAAGMQGGLTSPARPWFKLGLPDKDLMEFGPVKVWLDDVRRMMQYVFGRSNLYNVIHSLYGELGTFGTGALMIESDYRTIIRCVPFTIGEYVMALDDTYRVDTFYRVGWKTAGALVKEFGIEQCSHQVQAAIKNDRPDEWVKIYHGIEPNEDREIDKADNQNMPYRSVYFEDGKQHDKLLRLSGYNTFPVMAPRWDVTGSEVYGRGPGMDTLPDVMMLQKMQEDYLEALDKVVRPPMNAPSSMKFAGGGTIISGGVNYVDVMQGQQGFTPTYQINPDLNAMQMSINDVRQAIREGFYNDLFMMLAQSSKNMTATEVAERHEEKLLMIGPVIERIQPELLDRIIDRTYDIMDSMGLIPMPPEELQGMDLQVEYISLLAQAQKLVGISTIEQFAGFVGNISAVNVDILDKVDSDQMVDEYGDMLGVPPRIIRSDDDVAKIRAARAEQMAVEQAKQDSMMAAENAKVLSQTDTAGPNALTAMTGQAGAI